LNQKHFLFSPYAFKCRDIPASFNQIFPVVKVVAKKSSYSLKYSPFRSLSHVKAGLCANVLFSTSEIALSFGENIFKIEMINIKETNIKMFICDILLFLPIMHL